MAIADAGVAAHDLEPGLGAIEAIQQVMGIHPLEQPAQGSEVELAGNAREPALGQQRVQDVLVNRQRLLVRGRLCRPRACCR